MLFRSAAGAGGAAVGAATTYRPAAAPSGRPHDNTVPGQGSAANVGGATSPSQLATTAHATMTPNKQTTTAPMPPRRPADLGKDTSFGAAFKAARQAAGGKGGEFTWQGKRYQTNVKGEKSLPSSSQKLRNMNPKGPSDRKSIRLNSSHTDISRMPSSA